MSIKELNRHYSFENCVAIFDEEAMTALELAGRTAAKVNEVVKAQNELEEKLPGAIAQEVNDHIEKGEFDRQINEHMGNLEARVDNLLSSVPEGGTTMDAEVLDIRMDATGTVYENAGSSVRAQVKQAKDFAAYVGDKMGINRPIGVTCVPGYMDGTGVANGQITIKAATENKEVTTDYIPLLDDAYFTISVKTDAGSNTGWGRVYVFDDKLVPLEAYDLAGGSGVNTITFTDHNRAGAAFVRVSYRTYGNAEVYVGYIKGSDMCRKFPYYWDASDVELMDAQAWVKGYPNGTTGEMVQNITDHGNTFTSALIPVSSGVYRLFYDVVNPGELEEDEGYYAWCAVYTYDKNGKFITRKDYPITKKADTGKYSVITDITLAGAAFVRISARSYGNANFYFGKVKPVTPGEGGSSAFGGYVKAIAHRGLSSVAPENTIPAYKAAKKAGFQYVECDVQFTSDGMPVLFHDNDMVYKTGGEITGPVSSHTWAEIKDVDVGSWFGAEFAGTTIPTLWDFLDYCRKANLHPYIEIKSSVIEGEAEEIDLTMTIKYTGMPITIIGAHLGSFGRWIGSNFRYGVLCTTIDEVYEFIDNNENAAKENYFLDVDVSICEEAASALESYIENGVICGLEVWTVNDKDTIINLPTRVTGVTSDSLHAGKVLAESVE